MADKRYYTVREVNAHIPRLEELFERVMQIRSQLKTLYERLERAGYAPTRDQMEKLPHSASAEARRDRGHFQALVEALRDQVSEIHGTGGQIKDIESGLVDNWPARSGADEVLLCWRYGEKEIAFFHDVDSGFAGRRPVTELTPPTRHPV